MREKGDDRRGLREVRAAQLRARAIRWAIGKSVLGTVFLLGALAYGLGPEPQSDTSIGWMTLLVLMSTVYVGLGLRTFSRVSRSAGRLWLPATIAWGVLTAVLLRVLITR